MFNQDDKVFSEKIIELFGVLLVKVMDIVFSVMQIFSIFFMLIGVVYNEVQFGIFGKFMGLFGYGFKLLVDFVYDVIIGVIGIYIEINQI